MFQYRKIASKSEDLLSIGALRASGSEGHFNFRIALFVAIDGVPVGMVLSYRLPDPYD